MNTQQLGRIGRSPEPRSTTAPRRVVAVGRDGDSVHDQASFGLAETALRAGLLSLAIVAGSNCVAALLAGAGALTAVQGVVLAGLGVAGVVRTDLAAGLLRPKGRIVLLAGLLGVSGALDPGFYNHFAEVGEAIVLIAALVSAARWVMLCVAVSLAGYLGSLALHGSTLGWMVGDGRYVVFSQFVTLAASAVIGLVMIALLRRFVAGAPQRLAAVRAGGPSLTPQLALAASAGHVALLSPVDARTLIAALTPGERDVVARLAAGRVPKQVARELSIALATVRSRIATAKRKTGARTLDQLVGLYAEAELGT